MSCWDALLFFAVRVPDICNLNLHNVVDTMNRTNSLFVVIGTCFFQTLQVADGDCLRSIEFILKPPVCEAFMPPRLKVLTDRYRYVEHIVTSTLVLDIPGVFVRRIGLDA